LTGGGKKIVFFGGKITWVTGKLFDRGWALEIFKPIKIEVKAFWWRNGPEKIASWWPRRGFFFGIEKYKGIWVVWGQP